MALLEGTLGVNATRAADFVARTRDLLGGLSGREIGLLGLAFKPGTDDVRDSPAVALADALLAAGAAVRVHDPLASVTALDPPLAARLVTAPTPEALADGADAILLATAWPAFATLDWPSLVRRMRRPVVGDGRGILSSIAWPPDVIYFRIGTPLAPPAQKESP